MTWSELVEHRDLAKGLTTETYIDALGREQWRVVGTVMRVLVTRDGPYGLWEVWHPDSLDTIYRTRDRDEAIARAQFIASGV